MPHATRYPKLTGETPAAYRKRRVVLAAREFRQNNRALHNERQKAWRLANPEKHKIINKRGILKHKYGLTPEEKRQMFENQEGLCAVCSAPICMCGAKTCVSHACVDHDHDTDEIRGLLCQMCNRGIGLLRDSTQVLRNAIGYLEGAA